MAANRPVESLGEAEFWDQYGRQESGSVDFKQQVSRAAKLQESMTAFANRGGGSIVLGVTDTLPARVVGVQWDQRSEERVQEAIRACQPPVNAETVYLDVSGRQVMVLTVAPCERGWTQTSDGRVLVRAGPTNRALVGPELLRFLRERDSDPVEDEPIKGRELADLDEDALSAYLRNRLGRRRIDLERDAEGVGLVASDGTARLAAVLLFGHDPQREHRRLGVVVSRFEGLLERGPVLRDRRELVGRLPDLVVQADRLVYEEMRRDAVIRGLVREEVPEFPPVVIREALVNALGHRDYSLRGATVDVRLYDDAVEIESPGQLPAYVTIDNLREQQYSRNVRIMDALQRLGLAEEAGTGIDRIYTEMENALLDPPNFIERDSSFVVRLSGRTVFTAEDRVWVGRLADLQLTSDAKIALVYARRHGEISNQDLRSLRLLDSRASQGILADLVKRGLLQRTGRGRGTRYVLGGRSAKARKRPHFDEQLKAILAFAERNGSVANRDVRGLLGVDRTDALRLLETLVAEEELLAMGARRARRYLPATPQHS